MQGIDLFHILGLASISFKLNFQSNFDFQKWYRSLISFLELLQYFDEKLSMLWKHNCLSCHSESELVAGVAAAVAGVPLAVVGVPLAVVGVPAAVVGVLTRLRTIWRKMDLQEMKTIIFFWFWSLACHRVCRNHRHFRGNNRLDNWAKMLLKWWDNWRN